MTLLIFNTLGPEGMKYKTTRFWWRMKGSCQAVGSWRQHEDIEPNRVKPENGVPGESLPLKGFKNIHILWLICKAAHNLTPNYLSSPTFLYLSIPSSFLKQDSWMCHMLSCLMPFLKLFLLPGILFFPLLPDKILPILQYLAQLSPLLWPSRPDINSSSSRYFLESFL